ncbi:MAG: phosphoribosylamine--glycine ligase [Bacteroidetes bacterium]|nr:phosphoribosylamine--glycine ligase [Bacteroidota bacterium]
MNILVLGSGGREHVFASKISQSPLCSKLFIAPGNAGTANCGTNLPISPLDFKAVADACLNNHIDMIVPGNEDPLVAGIVDFIQSEPSLKHILILGPPKAGAMLEGSKDYSKAFMKRHNIPTAAYLSVTLDNIQDGYNFLDSLKPPYVLKADGLAAGKGVLIEADIDQAKRSLMEMLQGKFGQASSTVVIEEFLDGIEMSCFVLTDGVSYKMLPEAKDYKRIGVGDTGLNTGGMGAVSPVPFADSIFLEKVKTSIVEPTVKGLQNEQIDYVGFIFIGLMNCNGVPKVIEYNCRMGDPETEVVLHRILNDHVELYKAACQKQLHTVELLLDPNHAVTVFLVSGGYPEAFEKGFPVSGIETVKDATVYQAGTKTENGMVVTNGGRVIAVTATADTMPKALSLAMQNADKIQFNHKYYRQDIGQDLMKYYESI